MSVNLRKSIIIVVTVIITITITPSFLITLPPHQATGFLVIL